MISARGLQIPQVMTSGLGISSGCEQCIGNPQGSEQWIGDTLVVNSGLGVPCGCEKQIGNPLWLYWESPGL